jgi:hypothetical protein
MAARPRRLTTALAVLACALAGCSAQAHGGAPASPGATGSLRGRPAWMLTRAALSQLGADSVAAAVLERSRVYQILRSGQKPVTGLSTIPVASFPSVVELEKAVTGGQLPAGTRAVLYDPEAWAYTPAAEQRDPAQAARQALTVARAHGLQLIVTPALNLTTAQARSSGSRWRQFLDLGLAGSIAKTTDVIELQAQSLERDTATYSAFVRAAAAQARAANPQVTVLAGLSTNPPGAAVDSQQLISAIRATSRIVNGYWLNVPGRGPQCPTCNAPRPDIGIHVLRALG